MMDAKKMNEMELNEVAGGTVKELEELVEACNSLASFQTHIPLSNIVDAGYIRDFLRDKMGIEANISLGFCGTGIGSKHNTYKDMYNGRSYTHEEVLQRIRKLYGKG